MIATAIGPKRILVIEDNPDLAYKIRLIEQSLSLRSIT